MPAPTPGLLEALLEGTSDAELVEQGRQIASARILTDVTRIYGQAHTFWGEATDPQRARLIGYSPALLSVAVHEAKRLEELRAAIEAKTHGATSNKEARDAALESTTEKALTRRDQAHRALLGAAGRDAALAAKVDAAKGTAEDGEALARGIARLAEVAETFIATPKTPVAIRAAIAQVTPEYLASLKAPAADLEEKAKAAKARATAVSQGALDREDGVNLLLLSLVIRAFEGAHDVDPTIPRLAPISTRRLMGKHTKAKVATPPAVESGAGG